MTTLRKLSSLQIQNKQERGIVKLYLVSEDAEKIYLHMEFIEGGTLRSLLSRFQKVPEKIVLAIAK